MSLEKHLNILIEKGKLLEAILEKNPNDYGAKSKLKRIINELKNIQKSRLKKLNKYAK